jgi:hypothetical protein
MSIFSFNYPVGFHAHLPIQKGNSPPLHMMTMFTLQLLVQNSEAINIAWTRKSKDMNSVQSLHITAYYQWDRLYGLKSKVKVIFIFEKLNHIKIWSKRLLFDDGNLTTLDPYYVVKWQFNPPSNPNFIQLIWFYLYNYSALKLTAKNSFLWQYVIKIDLQLKKQQLGIIFIQDLLTLILHLHVTN